MHKDAEEYLWALGAFAVYERDGGQLEWEEWLYPALVKELKEAGVNSTPVTVKLNKEYDAKTKSYTPGTLIFGDGHHRLLAALELGWTEILAAYPDPEEVGVCSPYSGCWNSNSGGENDEERYYRESLLKGTLELV